MRSSDRSVPRRARRRGVLAALAAFALLVAACGGSEGSSGGSGSSGGDGGGEGELTGEVRLGYFPNVTHASALVGVSEGIFQEALGDGVELTLRTFNAGGEVIEALLSGGLDVSFIGPNPAINGFARSEGQALRIIAGTTSGGAYLVTTPDITSVEQLAGKVISTPALGNTQDVALRAWLAEHGLATTPEGGGDVPVQPQANAQILETFIAGTIDGAWVPEPWATRLIEEGGGHVLVDERDLWTQTGGEYVTTHVIVATEFLEERPDLVEAFLRGHLASIDRTNESPDEIAEAVAAAISEITGTSPNVDVIRTALGNLTITPDPIAVSLHKSAEDAIAVGLLDPVDLDGIYDLTILNRLLAERGEPEVGS